MNFIDFNNIEIQIIIKIKKKIKKKINIKKIIKNFSFKIVVSFTFNLMFLL